MRLRLVRGIRFISLCCLVLFLQGCGLTRFSDENATGYRHFSREECVPYARRVSGIEIYGDAYTWWNQAAGIYPRGNVPAPGAVLVLAKTNRLKHGHLAVVSNTLSAREIMVTHTNWGDDWLSRRVTYESLRVNDVSPRNDWTSVRFWNHEINAYGAPYPAYGFIYKSQPAPVATQAVVPAPIQPAGCPSTPCRRRSSTDWPRFQ